MAANPVLQVASLKIVEKPQDSQTLVRPKGRITAATSIALEQRLHDLIPAFRRVVLDVSNVDYIDGAGFGVLASIHFEAKLAGCALEIVNPRRLSKKFCAAGCTRSSRAAKNIWA